MANIQDVAKRAGVSIATVSRVLNGTGYVNSDVKARVDAAIQDLHYQPSRAARSLRVNHSTIIALLVADIQNPFFMGLIQGVEDVTQSNSHSLILCNSDENPQKELQYLDILYAERVAGMIIVPTQERIPTLKRFQERSTPIVAVDRRLKDEDVDVVLMDNIQGAREAVTHLLHNGYRRIGIISGPKTTTTGWERIEGYRLALREAGLPLDPALERYGTFKTESGRQCAAELLTLTPPPDALFVANYLMTVGALDVLQERHLRIPEDIALAGYDTLPWAAQGLLPLTTVTQPAYELGSTAAQRLFQRLQNPAQQARQEIVMAPTLMVRDSSRPRKTLFDAR